MIQKLVAMVIMVIVIIIAIPLIPTSPEEQDPDGWQYDEYRPVGSYTEASGALEIVTVGGVEYIHAKDLGTGKLILSDGSTETIQVGKAHLDVCFMFGQSNSAYVAVDPSQAPVPVPGTAYYYGSADGRYSEIKFASASIHSMTNDDGTAATADKAPSFAIKYNEITGHRVYWVCGSINGKSITTFDPDGGMTWNYADEVVEYAIKALDKRYFTYDSIAYMWIQGEADKNMAIDEYKSRFLEMNKAIMDGGLAGQEFHHAFISKVRTASSGTAQAQLAEEYPDMITMATTIATTFTQANGLLASDNAHYTQAGDNLIGTALGESMGQWVLQNPQVEEGNQPIWKIIGIFPLLIIVAMVAVIGMTIVRRII